MPYSPELTFCTPLNSVLVSQFHPPSLKLPTSHSASHPKGKKAFISAATNNLFPPAVAYGSSCTVQNNGLMPYRSLTPTNNSRRSSHITQANSPLNHSVNPSP